MPWRLFNVFGKLEVETKMLSQECAASGTPKIQKIDETDQWSNAQDIYAKFSKANFAKRIGSTLSEDAQVLRSFFSAPREHGPPANFFLLIGFGSHYRGHFLFEHKLKARALGLYNIMVKRKAEKQQSAGKPFIYVIPRQFEAHMSFL